MLTEKQVRARIKARKIRIKRDKAQLSTYNFNNLDLVLKADLRYQKAKLKLLRRELPMKVYECYGMDDHGYVLEVFCCPICDNGVNKYASYCPHCGQRVREWEDGKSSR